MYQVFVSVYMFLRNQRTSTMQLCLSLQSHTFCFAHWIRFIPFFRIVMPSLVCVCVCWWVCVHVCVFNTQKGHFFPITQGEVQQPGDGVVLSGSDLVLQKVSRLKAGRYWCSSSNSIKTTTSEPVHLKLNCKHPLISECTPNINIHLKVQIK